MSSEGSLRGVENKKVWIYWKRIYVMVVVMTIKKMLLNAFLMFLLRCW